ncbi:MAG: D-aminoacyl-tRNA deacylase [Coraliomargaritaceae bacterium]
MRSVIQRVSRASVRVEGDLVASVDRGLLLLLGVGQEDNQGDVEWLATKVSRLRIWEDEEGLMNRSLADVGGSVLVVSQFTLWGNLKKGSRPSYNRAASPEPARVLYEAFVLRLSAIMEKPVPSGRFGQHMDVELLNDGPVTLILDSRERAF